jgi:cytochrome-b5 reductase
MPNLYQLVFLASLFFTFSTLVLLFHFINAKLVETGYNVSRIILIGLPDNPPPPQRITFFDIMAFPDLHAISIPLLGTVDIVALVSSPPFIFTAVIVIATGIYSTVFHTSSYSSLLSSFQFLNLFSRPH